MTFRVSRSLLVLLFANMVIAEGEQIKLFINQLPEYSSLASCAERPVSTIVRGMNDGCGDGSRTTSYNCFCHESSAHYSSWIGMKVEKACATNKPKQQVASAVELFDSYCHLGDYTTETTTSSASASTTSSASSSTSSSGSSSEATPSSTSPSPESTPQMTSAPATSTPSSSPAAGTNEAEKSPKKSNTAAIAAGVTVPVVAIAAALAVLLLLRRRKQKSQELEAATREAHVHGAELDSQEARSMHSNQTDVTGHTEVYELKQDTAPLRPVEIGGSITRYEMPEAVPAELPNRYSRP